MNLFSILASDAIAVPVLPGLPYPEVKYILDNADAKMLLLTEIGGEKVRKMTNWFISADDLIVDVIGGVPMRGHFEISQQVDFPDVQNAKGGLMLYTSGTTNRPVRDLQINTAVHTNHHTERCLFTIIRTTSPSAVID